MTVFFTIIAWALLEASQDPAPAPRLISPAALFSSFREMLEIFLLTALGAGILFSLNIHVPGLQDFLAAAVMILFYFYGQAMQRRESFVWMAFACVFFFSQDKNLSLIALHSAETAAGVTGLRFVFKGLQKRRFLAPAPEFFSGLPGFFITAAVVALIFSALFVR